MRTITETINRYKDNQAIKAWQVENEPFLKGFGECPKLDKEFLDNAEEFTVVSSNIITKRIDYIASKVKFTS